MNDLNGIWHKYWNVILITVLGLIVSKWLWCLKNENVRFKSYGRKIKITIYDLCQFWKSGRVLDEQIYKNAACGYGYKLVCVDAKLIKPFNAYLREDSVYSFINSMVKESKYCGDVIKNHFNKELQRLKMML